MPAVLTNRPVGAHAPVAGGLAKALSYVDSTEAQAVQVFVTNPRGWALTAGDPRQDEAFAAGCTQRRIPVFVHACYLVNFGSPTAETVRRSAATITHTLRRAAQIRAQAVVYHAGSVVDERYVAAALDQVGDVLRPILDESAEAGGPDLLVEPTAGGGRSLASRVTDLGRYLEAVSWHPKLRVCLDTCHAWAAGHDLSVHGGLTATMDTLVATVGPARLALVHANDSKDSCGSLRDRHESIGAGHIGQTAFAELMHHPATDGVPIIVETPSDGPNGHAADIATLHRLTQ